MPVPESIVAARARADLLVPYAQVIKAIDQLSVRLTLALAQDNPLLLTVLEGGLPFAGALQVRLHFPLQADSIKVNSYGGGLTGGELNWHALPASDLGDRHVVLIDDVLDKGNTLAALKTWALEAGARSVRTAVLVDKQVSGRTLQADFVALTCPDRYLFGWGMDLMGYWRNADGIYALAADDPLLRSAAP